MIQMEIGFNILYLLTIYVLVFLMFRKHRSNEYSNRPGAGAFLWAFLLLAIGDTGHVGFRVLAYAKGGLENNEVLVGLGALATAITITLFYFIMVEVWRKETGRSPNWVFWLVALVMAGRFVFMTLEGNNWGQVIPPYEFSLIRNSFLTVMGIIVVILFVQKVPMIGMLMIPKTIAYVLMALFGYRRLFLPQG